MVGFGAGPFTFMLTVASVSLVLRAFLPTWAFPRQNILYFFMLFSLNYHPEFLKSCKDKIQVESSHTKQIVIVK